MMLNKRLNKKGFTLVELLIVVVILAILFLIAVARVPQVLTRAREAKTREYLVNLRIAINNYYSTNQGFYPKNLDDKTYIVAEQSVPPFVPHYMPEIPKARLRRNLDAPTDSNSNKVEVIDTQKKPMKSTDITNKGGWIYSSTTGEIRVNCNQLDSREKIYYSNYGYEDEH